MGLTVYDGESLFEGIDLRGASITYSELYETNFKAELEGVNFSETGLEGSNFSGADLKGAFLKRARMRGADFSGADLENAILFEADLRGANLSGANLSGTQFYMTTMPNGSSCTNFDGPQACVPFE